jgi:hypothetical protein
MALPNLLSVGKQPLRSDLPWSMPEGQFCRGLSMAELLPIAQEPGNEDSNVPRARTRYCVGNEKTFLSILGMH